MHIEELKTMEASRMSRKFCTPVAGREDTFAYLQILDAEAAKIEWVIVELAPPVGRESMKGWHT